MTYLLTYTDVSYALSELRKDVEAELLQYPESERESLRSATQFAVFVVHNKKKPKLAELPSDTLYNSPYSFLLSANPLIRYFAGADVGDCW
jgi:hypoxanthine phosphoribosyltransferase